MTTESRLTWWQTIACFMLGLIALAAIISYFMSAEYAIFLFSILVIFVSLIVSKCRIIDRLRADQIYYSLVAIVISAAYTVEAAKRDQVTLQLAQRQSLD